MTTSDHDNRPAESARFPALVEVQAYWQALRGPGGAMPTRSAVDPRGIAGALDVSFIAERVAPGMARFRLAGMVLCDLLGMDLRGMPITALIDPPARDSFARAAEAALSGKAAVTLILTAERGIGRPALEGRMLLLPLAGGDGMPGMALGCLALDGRIGRAPRRFALIRVVQDSLGLPAPAAAAPVTREPQPGMAEPSPPYDPGPPRRGHLRLVKG